VWQISIPRQPFSFRPTYDIDIAWSYRFKGFKRSIGAGLKEVIARNWSGLSKRIRVLSEAEDDPYNSFVFLMSQHMMDEIPPIYFILAAQQSSAYDKNIAPQHPRMAALIQALSGGAIVGLHPSYFSDTRPELLLQEKAILEHTTQKAITQSRQHYIKLRFPQTYKALIDAGIEEDWSMGYSTHFGFRAGTGASFLWYDLKEERATSLRIYPFAFMDTTARYDLGLSVEDSFRRLREMAVKLQACGGILVTIMHNFSLATDPEWSGWRTEYERFLRDIKTTGNTA
jgi:hypothetical protein